VIGFKDKQTELWEVKTLTMLREIGKSLPIPTAIVTFHLIQKLM
jgi:hypothetical protein